MQYVERNCYTWLQKLQQPQYREVTVFCVCDVRASHDQVEQKLTGMNWAPITSV